MIRKLTKLLIVLSALAVVYIVVGQAMEIADECWENRTINSIGWKGYCSDMSTVNPKHYLKCEEVLSEKPEANATVQYELED